MKGIYTILLLIVSNVFMTFAWYGNLNVAKDSFMHKWGLLGIVILSWGIAFFEYLFMVPANRIGSNLNSGPFSLFQLKMIQEVISLTVFCIIVVFIFKTEKLAWNHILSFVFLLLGVYFMFKK
jgi:uncharacterized protein (DUF486 family)